MCRQGGKYAAWVDLFHGDRKIGASWKLWGKEEELKLGSRKQLFHARNFCGGGVQRGLPPRLDIRQPPLGVLWLLSVATESNNFASADATGAASKTMLAFMNASSPQLSVKNWKICSGQQHFQNGNIVPNYTEREYQTGKTGYPEEENEEYTEAERACTGGRARDKQIAAIWRSDFGALPTPAQVQRLSTAADVLQMPLTVLREAVRCAAATGAKSPTAYVLTLLQDWHYAGVRTADEVGEYAYLRDVVEGRQPGDRGKAQQALAQMRRRHQQMPDGSEEGADG